ncbi:uncharacterized protein LOC110446557 [Mizuhopecten yessoensis]|uniref:YqaJ viral recombinase domain-containing protein n=1 Tax=Mizuhopecten yessoensis TaxID=6573 RepID=A0A210QX50_MIZYE|nr:uncharacterized protein LOC110446557 [Mizuhopecten yessoensis]XP_021347435.1 uncharacterized protein LOC110446557 [Mizuhopecten yessoensis]OWF53317.1 hypothetical protein KP79_PYT00460 [Mizuhopecten yessoensis]
MEIDVKQRSEEWFQERNKVVLTASRFGEALGVGRGRSFDFLCYLVNSESEDTQADEGSEQKANKQHGVDTETAIFEAYQLIVGTNESHQVRESGFWVPRENDMFKGLLGATPDAVVTNKTGKVIGVCEFKAPIHNLFGYGENWGRIPRYYMAQIQGQMYLAGVPWCDFMAVCTKTKEILLKRVYFQPSYWTHVSSCLGTFCHILQEARQRKKLNKPVFEFEAARKLQTIPFQNNLFPGEGHIRVVNLLRRNNKGEFGVAANPNSWFTYSFLMGVPYNVPPVLKRYSESLINTIDKDIQVKKARPSVDKVDE